MAVIPHRHIGFNLKSVEIQVTLKSTRDVQLQLKDSISIGGKGLRIHERVNEGWMGGVQEGGGLEGLYGGGGNTSST